MGNIPKEPREIFEEFVKDYREAFGGDLVSVILYGSGARGEYIPKKSDINFLIVLSEEGMNRLARAFKLVARWHKRMVATPLFMSRSHLVSSLDSFPIEILNLKACYQLVYGEDVLKDLSITREHIRLQCERELKGKLIQLRKGFLESYGRKKAIERLILHSLPAFFSIFQSMVYLKEGGMICENKGIIEKMEAIFGLEKGCFSMLAEIREGKKKVKSDQEAIGVMDRYIGEIVKLSGYVDKL
jgi:predicted nucleotidyltransferase